MLDTSMTRKHPYLSSPELLSSNIIAISLSTARNMHAGMASHPIHIFNGQLRKTFIVQKSTTIYNRQRCHQSIHMNQTNNKSHSHNK